MTDDRQEHLEAPPRPSTEDPGAHDLESSESEDHFSDAQSGLDPAESTPVDDTSSHAEVPLTRVEKVDDEVSYGEKPGTEAYRLREQDAAPDEIAIVPDHKTLKISTTTRQPSTSPGGQPIPLMIVEKVDPSSPSHGEVPGTLAHDLRAADSVPDLVVRSGNHSPASSTRSRAGSTPGDLPIPITKVEKIDSSPCHGEVPGTRAYELRRGDAEPDIVEEVGDVPGKGISIACTSEQLTGSGSPTSPAVRSSIVNHARRKSSAAERKGIPSAIDEYDEAEDGSDGGFGDDFDEFEEGDATEFGDFDDGFQEAAPAPPPPQSLPVKPSFPVLDFANLDSPEEIQAATDSYMNAWFPPDSIDTSVLPPISAEHPIFLTPRSASLWSQLVAPPPLQPPNWIRSRIRRLFLVSLGVPVDLDEILPASKQKKLILPSMSLQPSSGSPRNSTDSRSISRLKQGEGNASTTSVDSQGKPSRSDSKRRRGPPPAPQLDLLSARQLCSFTDQALDGLTLEELKAHVSKLEEMQGTAKEVLEYWTKRTDEKLGDRDAFEGVIENLVKHARKVRK
ncbi:hypothetical protein QTJ16_003725 [Diplocarpon rosae]|uniref:Uncharacterized protein n=1 Tax=Diplocarpon rosae TaxID=946125 RepID=A0AAD9WCR0_9HELO|nr:hypothetical protein QTJ16_003725 [Diplocarpon rosae]PBP28370.1 hypothetical protein BUE80_DR000708 [Diplocarpon rosae]